MREPIKRGDMAEVIGGARGHLSPNLGRIVTVGVNRGDHSRFGRIVRVHADGLEHYDGSKHDELDMAVAWLRKINPPPVSTASYIEKLQLETQE